MQSPCILSPTRLKQSWLTARWFSLSIVLACILCFSLENTAHGAAVPKIFGSIEFKGSMKGLKQWLSVKDRHYKDDILVPGSKINHGNTWDSLMKKLEGKSTLDKLKIVNNFWNQWPYKQDSAVYKAPDYWATPSEFRKRSGDCEDYAIAKYFTLRSAGFPMEQMRIVVVKDTILKLAHAILAVYVDEEIYILDNLSRNVLSHSRIRNYIPQYSVNEKNRWMHVMPKKK